MRKTIVCLLLSINVWAQTTEKPTSFEKLLEKQNPHQYRALKDKEHYLGINNYRNHKKFRFYIGDTFCFKTVNGERFQDEIVDITDSTFTSQSYNSVSRHFDINTFKVNEIKYFYKKPKHKLNFGLAMTSFIILLPLGYDWVYYKIPPAQNIDTILAIPIYFAGGLLIANRDLLFNRKKINDNFQLKIYQSL